ncbi:hypothetical protein JOM56_006952 [Amanita muscaria]
MFFTYSTTGLYKVHPTNDDFVDARSHFNEAISPQYWCLVNCNHSVTDVPDFLSATRAFIVQAASPHSEHIDWVKKYSLRVPRYFMKSWTLPELIIGRALQPPMDQCSERGLELFYSRYVPSARMAYTYANNLDDYEAIIDMEITRLTFEMLGKMLSSEALQVEHVSHNSHHILLVNPQSNRSRHSITIPSCSHVF